MALSGVADLTGRVLARRYRLLASIGAGASGRVYAADDVRLRRRVAVKVLHTALAEDAGFLRRFRAEAQLAASLHHPNVVAVYDWGEDDVPFMVLELLEGGSLRGMLDHGRRLSPAQAAHVGRQVARALEYAHSRGLVHRDIKPANLLFDEHGSVRVADFGLARALASASWTEPMGAVVGTARYAAPEQATGAPLDGRADLYALALVLLEAVTGDVPFVADTPLGTLAGRTQRSLRAPESLGPLAPVIERAGCSERGERYPDARTMASALGDAEDAFPPAKPLALVGLDHVLDDPDPTQVRRTLPSPFDQDAPADEIVVVDEPEVIAGEAPVRAAPAAAPRGPSSAGRWTGVVVALVVAAAIVAAAALLARGSSAPIAVPNVVGTTRTQAIAAAQQAGLRAGVRLVTSDDPVGVVVGQVPRAGAWSSSGGMELLVSKGPPPVAVPTVAGQPLDAARGALGSAGFVVSVQHRYSDTAAKGTAMGTEPAGSAPPGSVVQLVVSDGPQPVPVPAVAPGSSPAAAAAALQAAGFASTPVPQFSDTIPAGQVIGTAPPAGQQVPKGSTVTIVVSKGPDLVTVPSVVGLGIDQATTTAQQAGLAPQVSGSYVPGSRVRAQDLQPGTQVRRGSAITLFF